MTATDSTLPPITAVAVGDVGAGGVDAAPGRTRIGTPLVVILGFLSAFAPLSTDFYLPALPQLQAHFHASAATAQLTLTASLIGLAGGQAVAGPLSDSLGRRRPMLIGVALFAVASLLCAMSPSLPLFVVGRLVQGAAGAAGIVISRAIVRDLTSGPAMMRLFSTLLLVNGTAPIAAPILGGLMLRVTSWQGLFVALALVGAALTAAVVFGVPETLPHQSRRPGGIAPTLRSFGVAARDWRLVTYSVAGALAFAAMFAYISGSPFLVEQAYGRSPQAFSLLFATNGLGIVLAGQAGGALARRMAPRRILEIGLAQCLVGGLALLAVTAAGLGFWATAACLFVLVSSIGLVLPSASALALERQAQNAGVASAFIGVAQFLFGALVAPLTGPHGATLLAESLPMAVVVASCAVAAVAVFGVLGSRRRE